MEILQNLLLRNVAISKKRGIIIYNLPRITGSSGIAAVICHMNFIDIIFFEVFIIISDCMHDEMRTNV